MFKMKNILLLKGCICLVSSCQCSADSFVSCQREFLDSFAAIPSEGYGELKRVMQKVVGSGLLAIPVEVTAPLISLINDTDFKNLLFFDIFYKSVYQKKDDCQDPMFARQILLLAKHGATDAVQYVSRFCPDFHKVDEQESLRLIKMDIKKLRAFVIQEDKLLDFEKAIKEAIANTNEKIAAGYVKDLQDKWEIWVGAACDAEQYNLVVDSFNYRKVKESLSLLQQYSLLLKENSVSSAIVDSLSLLIADCMMMFDSSTKE